MDVDLKIPVLSDILVKLDSIELDIVDIKVGLNKINVMLDKVNMIIGEEVSEKKLEDNEIVNIEIVDNLIKESEGKMEDW